METALCGQKLRFSQFALGFKTDQLSVTERDGKRRSRKYNPNVGEKVFQLTHDWLERKPFALAQVYL